MVGLKQTKRAILELLNIQVFYDIQNLLRRQLPDDMKNDCETQDDHNEQQVQLNQDIEVIVMTLMHIHPFLIPISRLGCLGFVT